MENPNTGKLARELKAAKESASGASADLKIAAQESTAALKQSSASAFDRAAADVPGWQ